MTNKDDNEPPAWTYQEKREIAAAAQHFQMTITTCAPEDLQTNGDDDQSVQVTRQNLVPTELNLPDDYLSLADPQTACAVCCAGVNTRKHCITRREPAAMLRGERARLHRVPQRPFTDVLGEIRQAGWGTRSL